MYKFDNQHVCIDVKLSFLQTILIMLFDLSITWESFDKLCNLLWETYLTLLLFGLFIGFTSLWLYEIHL